MIKKLSKWNSSYSIHKVNCASINKFFFKTVKQDAKLSDKKDETPLYLNPHAWKGLPSDQIFKLHNTRLNKMGKNYTPTNDERNAILSTISSLSSTRGCLDYVFEINNFKERHMNNTPLRLRNLPPKYANVDVVNKGETIEKKRRNEYLTRVLAYQVPLLYKFRKKYISKKQNENPLKFSYFSDFTSESNVKNRRVVLTCNIKHLNLTEKQEHNLKILLDKNYNFVKTELTLESDVFPLAIQNARYLAEILNNFLNEAKNSDNDFSDFAVRKNHVKQTSNPNSFLDEWKRPQDAPVKKYRITENLIKEIIVKKDSNYLKTFSP